LFVQVKMPCVKQLKELVPYLSDSMDFHPKLLNLSRNDKNILNNIEFISSEEFKVKSRMSQ